MIIKLYWPGCRYVNRRWGSQGIDSYWLECSYEEAKQEIFPHLTPEQIEASKRKRYYKTDSTREIRTGEFCFLVSKDLQSIEPFPWYYPHSGQWNAYCPFKSIGYFTINKLEEIPQLVINK